MVDQSNDDLSVCDLVCVVHNGPKGIQIDFLLCV